MSAGRDDGSSTSSAGVPGEALARRVAAAPPRRLADAVPKAVVALVERPSWPATLEQPPEPVRLGTGYDTVWSRRPLARHARAVLLDNVSLPATRLVARPEILGRERLDPLAGPCLFVANHSSHLDTAIVLAALPVRFRHRCVVGAAADTFFDRRWKAALWSFALASIPIERRKVNRASADLAADLLEQRWSVIVYPEGGRSPDGWGQEFTGGAAYLAKRSGAPVVPVHLHGVRPILPKGGRRLRPGKVTVRFGAPLRPLEAGGPGGKEEDARRFAVRIERAVAELADEAETDWWSARRRAAAGETPSLQGPAVAPWRRAWELPESRRARPAPSGRGARGGSGADGSGGGGRGNGSPWDRRGR